MVTYSLTFDDKIIKDIIDDLSAAPRREQQYVSNTVKSQMERDIEPLKQEPPEPDYPFIWSFDPAKQARARAWWFANLKRKGSSGGRYTRTHGLVEGWTVDVSQFRNSVLIAVDNPAERAVKWTQSVFQVPSHHKSGWAQYEDVVLRAEENAVNTIIDAWYGVVTGEIK